MPTYTMTGPDGRDYSIDGPPGATKDQVTAAMAAAHAAAQAPAPVPQPQQSPGDAAFAAGQQEGGTHGAVLTAIDQAARQYLPLGLGNDVGAAARYVGQRVTGVQNPDTFATDLAYSGGVSAGEQAAHPVAGTIGGLTGGVGQAAALTPLVRAGMPFKASLALKTAAQGGTKLGNAAKLAAQGAIAGSEYGATQGGVQGGINNGDPSLGGAAVGAAEGTATGALSGAAGGLAGGGLTAAASAAKLALGPASDKAWRALADKFGVSPNDLFATLKQFRLDTGGTVDPKTGNITGGRMPALGELTDLHNRGEIAALVGKSPKIGAQVTQAAQDSASALPGRLNQSVVQNLGPEEDVADLVAARKAHADAAMKPIRNQTIPLDPEDVEFLRGEVLPHSGLTQLGRKAIHNDLDQGQLSLGAADSLRQSLEARAQANPGEGFDSLARGIKQIASDASPEYEAMLNQYTKDSQYINGHMHGLTGKTPGQTSDPGLISDIQTPQGSEGYRSGLRTRMANQAFKNESSAASTAADMSQQGQTTSNLNSTFSPLSVDRLRASANAESRALESLQSIAPSSPQVKQQNVDATQAGLSLITHTAPVKVFHAIKAVKGLGMPDNVAKLVGNYLTDPRMTEAGINIMRKFGMDRQAVQQLLQKAAVGSALSTTAQTGQ